MESAGKTVLHSRLLALIALALVGAVYFMPIWWVSLTAPNYPADAFPQGIRIHFHMNGVYNGCTVPPKTSRLMKETLQEDMGEDTGRYNPILDKDKPTQQKAQALDCVHEMNTINHYVGMHPIDIGAPVERQLAKFFFGFFAVMIVGFLITERKLRTAVLAAGFVGVGAWMAVDLWVQGSLTSFTEHYMTEAGRFFREPERIRQWGNTLQSVTNGAAIGLMAAMLVVVALSWLFPSFQLVLVLIPALLPVFFVITYAGWLWFFGHNLHPWGAFTVKPFMPTVFGEGKVAQFSTYSYPYYGYGVLMAIFVLLALALLLRRKALRAKAVS